MSGECGSYKGKGQLIGRLSAATRPARTTLVSRAITLRDSESVCRAHELLSPCGPSAILYLPVFRVALLDLILHLTGEYRATEPQCLLQSPESELGSQSPTTRWTCFPRSKRIIHPRTNPRQLRAHRKLKRRSAMKSSGFKTGTSYSSWGIGFRVYQGLLAERSPVFKGMFSLLQPPESLDVSNRQNACPVVH